MWNATKRPPWSQVGHEPPKWSQGEPVDQAATDEADAALDERHRLMAESEKAQAAWRVSPQNPEVKADMAARRRRESVKAAEAEAVDRQSRWNGV